MEFIPTKLYYKIREVAEIVGVQAHVLRFWETEFPSLSPPKSKSGQRTYRPRDIEMLLRIRHLLYEEGFTIPGARKRLGIRSRNTVPETVSEEKPLEKQKPQKRKAKPAQKPERLSKVKSELENILTLLDRG